MSRRTRKRITWGLFGLVLAGLVTFDLSMTHGQRSFVTLSGAQGVQVVRPLVALATSRDLSPAVALDSPALTYGQVEQLVYLALDRDQSAQSLRAIVGADDWVAIKVNMVTAPLEIGGRKIGGFWNGREDNVPHWGSVSDLRVAKALISYLIERVGPRRISIVEGSGEIARTGSPYFDSYPIDGWTVTWEAFDDLSYQGIVDGFNAAQTGTVVDIVDLLDDEPVLTPVPGGGLQLLGGQTRGWGYDDFVPGYGTPRVWVNGELALGAYASPFQVNPQPVHLRQGSNTVLVKVRGTARGAGFGLSLVDQVERGRMLTGIRPGPSPLPTAVTGRDGGQARPAAPTWCGWRRTARSTPAG
ncbi:MAG: hypothetical protein AB1505_19040 [Candidatus Latescibacterota bacterium]